METSNSFSRGEKWFYCLMNKDEKILEFEIQKGFDFSIIEVKRFTDKLPIGFTTISNWVNNRQAPHSRENRDELFTECLISNVKDFIDVSKALSLNDSFWIKSKDELDLTWNKVNLLNKMEFNQNLSNYAMEGFGEINYEDLEESPEFGTDGSFAKCWVKNDDGIFLLKRGSQGFLNAGLEPYSEFYASQLSKEICESYVDYDLVKYHKELACSCKLFSDEKIGYSPIVNVIGRGNSVDEIISYFDSIGSGDKFRSMIVFDGVVMNMDRHLNNYGVLFNNETMDILEMAPVFDNNMSLLPYAMKEDFENFDEYLETKGPKFGGDWVEIARFCLTPKLRKILNNLYGFKFKKHSEFNLSDERLDYLNKAVNSQIEKILKRSEVL